MSKRVNLGDQTGSQTEHSEHCSTEWEKKFIAALYLHGIRFRPERIVGVDSESMEKRQGELLEMPEQWGFDWAISQFEGDS